MSSFNKSTEPQTARTCFSPAAFGAFIVLCMFFSASIISCSGLFSEQKDNSSVTFTLPSSVLKSLTTSTTVLSSTSGSRSATIDIGSTVSLAITISGGISYSGTFSRTITVENDAYSIDPITISGLQAGKTVTIGVRLYNTDGTLLYIGTSDALTLSEGTNTAAITLTDNTITSATLASCTKPLTLVLVAGGSFTMGSESDTSTDNTAHTATVSDFYMSTYETTIEQYATVNDLISGITSSNYLYPQISVTWYNAVSFCNTLSTADGLDCVYTIDGTTVTQDLTKNGYRLPTETEWEYAANGGIHESGYTYSGSNTISDVGVYNLSSAATVGSKSPNALGIYDMSGNVWEWCWDWYSSSDTDTDYDSDAANSIDYTGLSAGTFKASRGGCFSSTKDSSCAVVTRGRFSPSNAQAYIGFRVVRKP